MVAYPVQRERAGGSPEDSGAALEMLAVAGDAIASAESLPDALEAIAEALARAVGADVVVARVVDDSTGDFRSVAVATTSSAVAAELEGSRFPGDQLSSSEEIDEVERLPDAVRRAAERVRAGAVLQLPVLAGSEVAGTLELMRSSSAAFDGAQRRLARLAAGQAGLAIRAFRGDAAARSDALEPGRALELAGDALAAGADEARTAEQVTRVAAETTAAVVSLLWRREPGQPLGLVASSGLDRQDTALVDAAEAVERAVRRREAVSVESVDGRLPGGAAVSATLQLGQPPVGALQLLFPAGHAPAKEELGALATFGVRAAHALRSSMRSRTVALELERTRALLAVVGQAIAQLSLAHTLETAVDRVAELLGADTKLAIYLRRDERLYAAAGRGLAGPHVRIAERLLQLTLGPFRGRGMLVVESLRGDPRLADLSDASAEAGLDAAIAVALHVHGEPIGLLGVYPPSERKLSENESALLSALATQLAVAVQNAQLHEEAKRLGAEREQALQSERTASKRVGALYEISRSFAQSLSLEATLDAVARTVVDVVDDVDIAVLRMPDERREWLVPRAMHVAAPRLDGAARAILYRPQPFGAHPVQRLFRLGEPFALTPDQVEAIGGPSTALLPFLERGWTGAVVPISTPAEVLASLTILSLRPGSPVRDETIEQATAIAGQAALAIDNARLYQQQKEFADTMQRSLLPRSAPETRSLEVGDAYQSSARVEVGGDVYDFMELDDGRLAVVLGDVTGHGIEAAADMAMAKFVFRSMAREHPDPADFLRAANDVVVGEIAPGKFITMVYLAIDGGRGEVAGAGAGHPAPRIVGVDGAVRPLDVRGLVLGVEAGQAYETVREPLAAGEAVVLYTDGVIEARLDGELYGFERLDALLSEQRDLSARDLAQAVLGDCRAFARGELADDCAVVVIKRTV